MSQFLIGNFDFINLSRPPGRPKEQLARELRSGGKGVTFFRTGVRSEPFQLLSSRDCYDLADAQATLEAYEDLVGQEPVEMWWGGLEWGEVIVHDVVPIDGGVHVVLLAVGGVLGGNAGEAPAKAMVRCIWTLEYVPLIENQNLQQLQ